MIEGLKFDVPADELKTLIEERMIHHNERALFYQEKANGLEGAEAMEYTNGDPVRNLRDKQKQHESKTQMFTFLRDHIVAGEVYRLQENDLTRLEIITGFRF